MQMRVQIACTCVAAMFLASNCTCADDVKWTAHVQLLAKNMAANKKTPYVILYWFSFKILLCMLILCAEVVEKGSRCKYNELKMK